MQDFKVLFKSSLAWTSVRSSMNVKDESSGRIIADDKKFVGLKIAAKGIARFMAD